MSAVRHLQILSYGPFYDFPRGAYVRMGPHVVALRCEFDEAADDYANVFDVSFVEGAAVDELYYGAFFRHSHDYKHVPIGQLPVSEVTFHVSRRMSLTSAKLEVMVAAYLARRECHA